MKDITILEEALHLIRTPSRWCQGQDYIRNKPDKYCAAGALASIVGPSKGLRPWERYYFALRLVTNEFSGKGFCSLRTWNDEHTHKQVVSAFKKAIAYLRRQEKLQSNEVCRDS